MFPQHSEAKEEAGSRQKERLGNGEWMEQNGETSSGHGSPGGGLGSLFPCPGRELGGIRKGVKWIGKSCCAGRIQERDSSKNPACLAQPVCIAAFSLVCDQ